MEAGVWGNLGYLHHHLGRYRKAIVSYERAVVACREAGHRNGEADALIGLGDARRAAGETGAARTAWRDACCRSTRSS